MATPITYGVEIDFNNIPPRNLPVTHRLDQILPANAPVPVPNPTAATHAANKGYVDTAITSSAASSTAVQAAPAGAIMQWGGGTTMPTGWVLCEGQALSRTTYSALYAVIGTMYGAGDGTTTFNVPDFRGRVAAGLLVGDADFDVMGKARGTTRHTLTAAEMPAHNHGVNDPSHAHGQVVTANGTASPGSNNMRNDYDADVVGAGRFAQGVNTDGATTGVSIQNAGSGLAHNNLQPYLTIRYIIKVSGSGDTNPTTAAVTPPVYDSGWVDLPLTSGWVHFDARTGQYRKIDKTVYLRGFIKNGALGAVFSTLPAGFRPSSRTYVDHYFPVVSNSAFGSVTVNGDGTLRVDVGSAAWVCLDGVRFVADQ